MEKIIEDNEIRKVVELPDGSVRITAKTSKEHSHYVRIPKKWWLETIKKLSPMEMCLWITLRAYANKDGFCYPSLRRIVSDTGISINPVRKYLKTLEKKGLIKIHITKKGSWRKWTYETYHI